MRAPKSLAVPRGGVRALVATLVGAGLVLVGLPSAEAAVGALSGTISDGSGNPLQATINVDQQGTTSVVASSTTAADGTYSIAVNNGTYDVVVTPQSSSYVPLTIFAVVVNGASHLDVHLIHRDCLRFGVTGPDTPSVAWRGRTSSGRDDRAHGGSD